ncbi:MAG: DUF2127 domain-containing protein [Gammaproteobacteria bacterium]|jgi:uncharacterized membrane protein
MRTQAKSRIVHLFFNISILAKGVDGVFEILGGLLLLLVTPLHIHSILRILTMHELSEDPKDLIANYLLNSTQHLSAGTKNFAAIYLLWHGAVKAGLVAALLFRKRWAYPAAMAAFFLFLVYQLYRYSHTASPLLLVLSAVDVFIIILTWLEYRRLATIGGFANPGE